MAIQWICTVLDEKYPNTTFAEFLKDGRILCRFDSLLLLSLLFIYLRYCFFRLMNFIQPNSIPKIHNGNIAFQKIVCYCITLDFILFYFINLFMKENIGSYIKAGKKLGMERDLFDIIDLFEEKNINYVC